MIERSEYLNELKKWKGDKVIKVITGIRRCGKSTLLSQYMDYLSLSGVNPNNIVSLNFESLDNEELLEYHTLNEYIVNHLSPSGMNYIFLDEIQRVDQFQKVIDSLFLLDNVDIYITGSNAYLLSGDLATYLTGRYIEVKMLPLSFKEYYSIHHDISEEDAFRLYLTNGGFPYVTEIEGDNEKVSQYLDAIYNTIIVKDVSMRLSNSGVGLDTNLLVSISRYLADTISNPNNASNIANYLTSNHLKTSDHTVSEYLHVLCEAFIFYNCDRYDIKGKQILKTNKKYYIADLGLRNYMISKTHTDIGYSIENIMYLELYRRGYQVNTGKLGSSEIDFIATKNGNIEYYQVTTEMTNEKTSERELSPLLEIKDNHPKTILTLDRFTIGNYSGVEVVNLLDWLLN